ncbi:uncharacterized protein LOC134665353 [Cydia fagiglandana]|uniref:uncharacterized protein LOC134665353 n=1 Tax=Cydia fagiglandana TaxID=1458189 RepID=UPI002FEE4AF5
MEADSTTLDTSPKDTSFEPVFPFPVSPGNKQLYNTFSTHSGERSLEWQIIEKLQAHGLLPKTVKCPTGKAECRVVCKNARVIDRVQWVCEPCGTRQPVRLGSFFMKLQCSLLQALQIILAWSEDADIMQAAQHFGVKDRVATAIYSKMDDLAIKAQLKDRLGGEDSVVLAEMYPDCVNRLSPDTTDTPHVHRILMLADTNHIPTRYWLHVIKEDNKKIPANSSLDSEHLRATVEEVVKKATLPNSIIVTGNSVPAIEGASSTQQLLQHCDADMQRFLTSRIWRGAVTLCAAARELCAGAGAGAGAAQCAGAAQRYLHAALYRVARAELFAHALQLIADDTTQDKLE